MKLTKKDLAEVKFRAKGKWYNARQVDEFLDELTVAVEEAGRELSEVRSSAKLLAAQLEALRTENEELRMQLDEKGSKPKFSPAKREQNETPEEERARLIEDIKALRALRERFRETLARDIAAFGEEAKRFASDEVLK